MLIFACKSVFDGYGNIWLTHWTNASFYMNQTTGDSDVPGIKYAFFNSCHLIAYCVSFHGFCELNFTIFLICSGIHGFTLAFMLLLVSQAVFLYSVQIFPSYLPSRMDLKLFMKICYTKSCDNLCLSLTRPPQAEY